MKKVLFIDRDGTIIFEPEDEFVDSFEDFEFVPKAISCLRKIVEETDYELVMVTNQDGLGTDIFPEDTFWPYHDKMLRILELEGVVFKEVLIDKSYPHEGLPTRKPGTGLVEHYMNDKDYDMSASFVIGDRTTDVEMANKMGCQSIYISTEQHEPATLCTTNWDEIYRFVTFTDRKATVQRKTKETDITVDLNLDGTGVANIATGIGFYDHMLEQLAKHSGCDMNINVKGDLHIDEHHTVEDTALALGEAFSKALGDKRGINRYGFLLPMDDALAQVALDFSGRNWLEWEADFKREKVGEMPTEMFFHFFKSFTDTAKCNLNIKAEGDNEHHKIEAIFKAVARSIKMAVAREGSLSQIPSTKGTI